MARKLDYSKAIYYVDGNNEVKESFPDEHGRYDDETEFWRDSQVSSGWLGAAYRLLRSPKDDSGDTGVQKDEAGVDTGPTSEAPVAERRARSRSRSKSCKTQK